MSYLFTSESVSEGHPDKVCDQISDAVLDSIFTDDPLARVACECFTTTGFVLVGGEITTSAYVDVQEIVRQTVRDIGYTDPRYRFDADSCGVASHIHQQSGDIFRGVKTGGAGDQGIMFGYASNASAEYMPLPIMYAHAIVRRLADVRKNFPTLMPYLRPDSKSQVTFEYEGRVAKRLHTVVVSTQHDPGATQKKIREDVIEYVLKPVFGDMFHDKVKLHVNPTGRFEIGGPHGDSGLTGRKIIVDTYGGWAPHGGGAFSGKDPSKVDRSAAYATRHLAKNLVAAGVADEVTIQIGYAIGVAKPVSIHIDTHGSANNGVTDKDIERWVAKNVDMTPKGIIDRLKLRRPIYRATAAYGHFGRNEKEFTWEALDMVKDIKKALV
jgi:S-adenosylmethionine synthetase